MQPRTHVETLETLWREIEPEAILWVVDIDRQCLSYCQKGSCIAQTPVSTAAAGVGNEPGSSRTPLGWHRAARIIGREAPLGQPFRSRKPVGTPLTDWTAGTNDAILSRIIILEGLVPGLNHHSRDRYIYLHGTNQEDRLGTACSHGCIRVGNQPLADWITRLGTALPYIWIGSVQSPVKLEI